MVRAWRIVSAGWAKTAFDGEGARLYGGRWNSPGRPAIYLAGSRALAALETLVHMSPSIAARQKFIRFEVGIPKSLVNQLDKEPNTFQPFVGADTQATGNHWLDEVRGLALRVPSAVIPEEHNYLLNPAHPRFNEIEIGQPEPFALDSRLIEGRG
jgi:RES domain-containing protein